MSPGFTQPSALTNEFSIRRSPAASSETVPRAEGSGADRLGAAPGLAPAAGARAGTTRNPVRTAAVATAVAADLRSEGRTGMTALPSGIGVTEVDDPVTPPTSPSHGGYADRRRV